MDYSGVQYLLKCSENSTHHFDDTRRFDVSNSCELIGHINSQESAFAQNVKSFFTV